MAKKREPIRHIEHPGNEDFTFCGVRRGIGRGRIGIISPITCPKCAAEKRRREAPGKL